MAVFFLEQVYEEESRRDDYALGFMSMEDAYEYGFIDESGCEQRAIKDSYDRNKIHTYESISDELRIAEADLNSCNSKHSNKVLLSDPYKNLNEKAIENLFKEHPSCNVCHKEMSKRNGKFGAFYFCSCEGQKTVSEKYWLSIRIK